MGEGHAHLKQRRQERACTVHGRGRQQFLQLEVEGQAEWKEKKGRKLSEVTRLRAL